MTLKKGRENKIHIGIFGRRNNGKSSLINALAKQNIAIVSDVPGTTTDPVKKSIELFGIGPVILIDTAGIDDTGDLGKLRIEKTAEALKIIDLAIIVITANIIGDEEVSLVSRCKEYGIPFFFIHNKADQEALSDDTRSRVERETGAAVMDFSCIRKDDTDAVADMIRKVLPQDLLQRTTILGDLIRPGDLVMLITPIDSEAPEGRMILPQVQVLRDVLDHDAIAIILKETEIKGFLEKTGITPALAVTDSQAFGLVSQLISNDIPLTSFSILLARQKGDFLNYLQGTGKISTLNEGDRILMLESCTHQVSCEDIGRIKLPKWLQEFTGKKLHFDIVAGLSNLPVDIHEYAMVIQCGGCVITRRQILNRLKPATDAGIPVTNYGLAIAYVHGIFDRATEMFRKK